MIVIGLTGGIGSGKTAVSMYLAELGAVIIDADKVGHEAFKPDTVGWSRVVEAFGNEIVNSAGEIDRPKLGSIVFNDPEALLKLNAIMHPRMKEIISLQIEAYREKGEKVVVLEAFGLTEAGWGTLVDEVWVTISAEDTVVKRLMAQRGLSEEEILTRIHSQTPVEDRIKHADVLINNDGNLDEMKAFIREQWARIQQ